MSSGFVVSGDEAERAISDDTSIEDWGCDVVEHLLGTASASVPDLQSLQDNMVSGLRAASGQNGNHYANIP